jgi:hypothetical protein
MAPFYWHFYKCGFDKESQFASLYVLSVCFLTVADIWGMPVSFATIAVNAVLADENVCTPGADAPTMGRTCRLPAASAAVIRNVAALGAFSSFLRTAASHLASPGSQG